MFTFSDPQHGVLDATREAGGHTLILRARQLRLDRDRELRGLVAMIVDKTPIHSNTFNLDKDSERHDFASALYGTLTKNGYGRPPKFQKDISAVFPQADFEQEFMLWSRTAWNAYIGISSGSYVEGDENPSAPPWAVPGLVMEGSPSIWAGDAGAGKSTLMRLTCQALNYGLYDIIPVRDAEQSIWVNAEESEAEHTRQLGNVNDALGIPRTTPMYTVHARGMMIEDLATRLEKAVRDTGSRHIFIDSLSRLARGMSLNENNTATLLVDSLAGLGCSVNWVGHTGWENRTRLAGSRHFENAARVMVLVRSRMSLGGASPELTRGVRTHVYKANGAVLVDDMFWTLNYHRQYGLLSAAGSSEDEWPVLRCDFRWEDAGGRDHECRARTWDGVTRNGVRCQKHRSEDEEV